MSNISSGTELVSFPEYLNVKRARIRAFSGQQLSAWDTRYDSFRNHELVAPVYERFKDRILNRQDLLGLYREEDLAVAATATMMWGGINVGRGHFASFLRTGRPTLDSIMLRLVALLQKGDVSEAFCFMAKGKGKLRGVDHSFFTKLLFFVAQSRSYRVSPQPLIFDKWTKNAFFALLLQSEPKSLEKHFRITPRTTRELLKNGVPVRSGGKLVDAYLDYNQRMDLWSKELNVTPGKLEEFLFGVSRKTKDGKCDQNPRNELLEIIRGNLLK